jgi:integration host factor subunit beta
MTRSELVQILSEKQPYLSFKEIEKVVKVIFDDMALALSKGERIEIRGFGSFSIRFRPPRVARNPRTGEKVQKPGKFTSYFRPGKELKERANSSTNEHPLRNEHPHSNEHTRSNEHPLKKELKHSDDDE